MAPDSSLSRTGAAVDEEILRERVGAVKVGRPAKPQRRTPSRAASTRSALSRTPAQRLRAAARAARFASPAGRLVERRRRCRSRSEKRTPGLASARRRTTSATACASAALALEEFEPRRRRGEQVAHLDPRARRAARGRAARSSRRLRPRARTPRRRRCARRADFEPRRPRRSRAAPRRESRAWRCWRGRRREFSRWRGARREAPDRRRPCRRRRRRRGSASRPPASIATSIAPRAGVERVLDQLLDRRGRPLDHFAGGDAVDQQRIEAANRHGIESRAASGEPSTEGRPAPASPPRCPSPIWRYHGAYTTTADALRAAPALPDVGSAIA